jgi:hypothetical protein
MAAEAAAAGDATCGALLELEAISSHFFLDDIDEDVRPF